MKQSHHYYQATVFRLINELQIYSIHNGFSLETQEKFQRIEELKNNMARQGEIPQLFEDIHLTTLLREHVQNVKVLKEEVARIYQ